LDTSDFLPGSQHTVSIAASDTSSPPVTGVITNTVTAASGTGASHTFSFNFTDGNPVSDAQVVFNFGPALNDACAVHYVPSAQQLYLADKTGLWSYSIPFNPQTGGGSGTLGDLVNTNCQIVGSGSSLQMFGNNLVLTLQVNFASSFIGPQNIYTQLSDTDGPGSYQLAGAWTAFPASANPPSGIAPSSYDSTHNTLTVAITDINGFNYMPQAYLEFGASQTDASNTCRILFQRGTGAANDTLTLFNGSFDAIGEIGSAPVGSGGVLVQSPACLLDIGRSYISLESGGTSTLVLAVTFTSGAIGSGTVNTYVGPVDRAGAGVTVPVSGVGTYSGFAPSSFFVQPDDFALTTQNSTIPFQAGNTQSFPVTVTQKGNFNSAVSFQCTTTNPSITCAVTGSQAAGYTGSVKSSAAGSGTMTITGTAGGLTRSVTIQITVTAAPPVPTFTVNWPTTTILTQAGNGVTFSLSVTGLNHWTAPVLFTIGSGFIHPNLSVCIMNAPLCPQSYFVSPGQSLLLRLQTSGAPSGNSYCASVTATGSQAATATVAANIVGGSGVPCIDIQTTPVNPNLQISLANTSVTIPRGGSVPVQLDIQGQGNIGSVTLTSSDAQGNVLFGANTSATIPATPGSATVNFNAGTRIPNDTGYSETITATSASGLVVRKTVTVTIAGQTAGARTLAAFGRKPPYLSVTNNGSNNIFIGQTLGFSVSELNAGSCSANGGISIVLDTFDSTQNTFNLNITASSAVSSGQYTITCTPTWIGPSIYVYDATPVISSVVQTPALYPGGNDYVTIYGSNLGSEGTVKVCFSGTNSCGDVTATTTQPAATYGFWHGNQINALLSASQNAAVGTYDLYVTVGTDLGGASFQPGPGNTASSGRLQIQVGAGASIYNITRDVLSLVTAQGSPPGGTFGLNQIDLNLGSHTTASFLSGVLTSTNPTAVGLSDPAQSGGNTNPGALSTINLSYHAPNGSSATKSLNAVTFGLSCYVTALENDYMYSDGSCKSLPTPWYTYTGSSTPPGLTASSCNSFLAEVQINGSGATAGGQAIVPTSPSYQSTPDAWSFQPGLPMTSSNVAPTPNVTIAVDTTIIPYNTAVTIDGQASSGSAFLAQDTGAKNGSRAIAGYRIDMYKGVGAQNCDAFSNPIVLGSCNPANASCPDQPIH
jgi:3D (Asp-Asp-Asp) domain-containing protein